MTVGQIILFSLIDFFSLITLYAVYVIMLERKRLRHHRSTLHPNQLLADDTPPSAAAR